jgi:hypothetical protein
MRPVILPSVATALVAAALSALAIGLVVAGGSYQAPEPGIPDPGALVAWGAAGAPAADQHRRDRHHRLAAGGQRAGSAGKGGVVSRAGRSDLVRACAAAAIWAVLAMAQMVFTLASVLGIDLASAASRRWWSPPMPPRSRSPGH